MKSCLDDKICGEHGICLNHQCQCLPYWKGTECNESFKDITGGVFIFWKVFFSVCFTLVLLFVIYRMTIYYFRNRENSKPFKILSYLFLLMAALTRILYLVLDPMKQTGIVPPIVTELSGGLSLYFLFTVFLFVLLYWIGLYHSVFQRQKNLLFIPKTKKIFFIIDGIWLSLEVIIRVLYGLQLKKFYFDGAFMKLDIFYTVYISVIGFSFSLGFMIYGALIYYQIRKVQIQKKTKENAIKKLTFIITILSWTFLIGVILLILLVRFKAREYPYGSIFALSLQFCVELALYLEIFYILKDDHYSSKDKKDQKKQSSSEEEITEIGKIGNKDKVFSPPLPPARDINIKVNSEEKIPIDN